MLLFLNENGTTAPAPVIPTPVAAQQGVERWVQRTGAEYAQSFADLLPQGSAWPREQSSALQHVVAGLSEIWGANVEASAALLLTQESDPRAAVALLPEWERAFGLPDECMFGVPQTIGDRQKMLVLKMTLLGAQSRSFFVNAAALLGYTIDVQEWSPFMCGVSNVGDTTNLDPLGNYRWEIGSSDMRFYWKVRVHALRLTWFRVSSGQTGVDPHLRIAGASDLECLLRRWKPSHTEVLFDYSDFVAVTESSEIVELTM